MKRLILLAALLLTMAGMQTALAQKMIVRMNGNQTAEFTVSQVEEVIFTEGEPISDETHGITSGHEWVDLGLPSGTLWATCNVGANNPDEYGDYFAWGETEPKSYQYFWDYYKWMNEGQSSWDQINKYTFADNFKDACWYSDGNFIGDGKTELLAEDDAATANWGTEWKMPSVTQINELINSSYTSLEWISINGVYGGRIISKRNGNSIFIPAAGYKEGWSPEELLSYGMCWSCSLDTECSYFGDFLGVRLDKAYVGRNSRNLGQSVRPVRTERRAGMVSRIVLSEASLNLQIGETKTLTASVLPENAYNKTVLWASSNESIATVSTSGLVTAKGEGSCAIICAATDGSNVNAECQVTVASGTTPDPEDHEWVDLGLPSGTLWATCNVGANSPVEYGDYFAWGETKGYYSGKSVFKWNYKYCRGSLSTMTKYCTSSSYGTVDNKTELEAMDDAATANWGSGWQMPSIDQLKELYNSSYTSTTWTTQNGVNGRKITSKSNGNSIFLPAAGSRSDTDIVHEGSGGHYWSRSLDADNSNFGRDIVFSSSGISASSSYRIYGKSVRPVRVQE